MLLSLLLGFVLGVVAVVAAEGAVLLLLLDRLRRGREASPPPEAKEARGLGAARPVGKQGLVWVLEPERVPKVSTNESPPQAPKDQKNKDIVEVFPNKKHARIKDHSLILLDVDGSQSIIELQDCNVAAVSATDLSSRKWAKRYPIKLESKNSLLYNGSKICYLYLETSWEKESWCKALRCAACLDKEKLKWYAQLTEEFHQYLASLNAEYPFFLKPSALYDEATDKALRIDAPSSRVRGFLKKLTKKASKSGVESKAGSTSLSSHSEKKLIEKSRSAHDVLVTDGLAKSSSEGKSSSTYVQDLVQPTSPTSCHLGDKTLHPLFPDAAFNEKLVHDEGTLCWNLLFSRLFFDSKRSNEINSAIKARIQRTLATMRTPSYIRGVICSGLDLGTLPPYIHKMRVLPMDLNEAWAVEVDIEYSGGIVLDVETRLEVCEPSLQEEIINKSFEPNSAGEVTSDLLEGIEHFGNQFNSPSSLANGINNKNEMEKADGLKHTKSSSWASNYISRWKAIKQSFADQVSQVPLSLSIGVASLRGTLRLHIKPPPSDQLWFGFTSMPEIDWNLGSSVGDRKISNAHIAVLISNRFKSAIRETLVLPNCESICIPLMLAEKDDWVPRSAAPFMWVSQETMDIAGLDTSNAYNGPPKSTLDSSHGTKNPKTRLDDIEEKEKDVIDVPQQLQESLSNIAASQRSLPASISSSRSASSKTVEDLKIPLLRPDETQESCGNDRAEQMRTSSYGTMATLDAHAPISSEEEKQKKGRRARMLDYGKKVTDRIEEKRRHLEEKSRIIVEKMRENTRNGHLGQ